MIHIAFYLLLVHIYQTKNTIFHGKSGFFLCKHRKNRTASVKRQIDINKLRKGLVSSSLVTYDFTPAVDGVCLSIMEITEKLLDRLNLNLTQSELIYPGVTQA